MKGYFLPSLFILTSLVAVISAAGAQNSTGTSVTFPTGDAQRGAVLFRKIGCYECHGLAAQGGAAPNLAPNPPPASVIAAYIRRPAGTMPPYPENLVDEQNVADIAAWLRTIPPSPDPDEIAILPKADVIARRP